MLIDNKSKNECKQHIFDNICEVLSHVNYIDVKSFCLTNCYYYDMLNQIIMYKQYLNPFPRINGRCQYHKISKEIVITDDNYNQEYMFNELNEAIEEINIDDLIYGDIIEFQATVLDQPTIMIYNGKFFEHLNYDQYFLDYLPLHYRHIYHNIPLNYWYIEDSEYQFPINFNFSIVHDQIVDNITVINNFWVSFFYYNYYKYNVKFIVYELDEMYYLASDKYSKEQLMTFDYGLVKPINNNTLSIHIVV